MRSQSFHSVSERLLHALSCAALALQPAAAASAIVQTGAPAAPAQAPVSPPPAKAPKMAPEAEQALLAFFALQDMLSREDARMLAQQVSASHRACLRIMQWSTCMHACMPCSKGKHARLCHTAIYSGGSLCDSTTRAWDS